MLRNRKLYLIVVLLMIAGIGYWKFELYRKPVILVGENSLEDRVISGGPQQDEIPSIDKPVFESVAAADQYLDDRGFGLMVNVSGKVRFYPYQILVWHQVVNEDFSGKSLLVTYCPLCGSGQVFERSLVGQVEAFGVSGKLLNSNLLMYDRLTNSLWSQILGKAIAGERSGQELSVYPSEVMTWDIFKRNYSTGQVLSRKTGFVRDYTHNPYGDYETSYAVMFPVDHDDDRLDSKSFVYGYAGPDGQTAYTTDQIQKTKMIQDRVGSVPLLIIWDQTWQTARGFIRTDENGSELSFREEGNQFIDEQTGSVWNEDGKAISGPSRGQTLKSVQLTPSFWFCWAAQFLETNLWNPSNN